MEGVYRDVCHFLSLLYLKVDSFKRIISFLFKVYGCGLC
nr:MAG TPA: hypothetical protein [Caudoviricetes sp.]